MDILTLSTADVAVTLRPAQGGRLTGLTDRRTGVQWLHEGRTGHPFVPAMAFRDGARGGFDECLPSVAACPYPDPQWGAAVVADHGDFWSWPWTVVSQSSTTITLDTRDVEHPLLLTRNVTVGAAGGVRLTYGLRNRSALPYLYLYSAHPLFALPDGGRLDLPPAPLRTAFGARLRPGTQSRWPYVLGADAGPFDYSDLCRDPTPRNDKVFVASRGWCRLGLTDRPGWLEVRQSPQELPWLGVCVNHGQWPTPADDQHWVALEPTTTPCDSLAEAAGRGWVRTLEPRQSTQWAIHLHLSASTR